MRCPLETVLRYSNEDVLDRFQSQFIVSSEETLEIFDETLRWIWLCAEAKEDREKGMNVPRLVIDSPIRFIDEGWHNFILFTKDYADFCMNHFGFFVHHNPTPKKRKRQIIAEFDSNESGAMEKLLAIRKDQYEYIYDKLGAEVLERWYSILSDAYKNLSRRE